MVISVIVTIIYLMGGFRQILAEVERLATTYPGHVFIGGVAVYLHAINNPRTRDIAEASHDADLMLALSDFSDLRDAEEVVPNRRLSKHQLIMGGVEFDLYVERRNSLLVPFDEAAGHAVKYGAIRVACLEHLLVLKLEAYRERMASAKGDKDARDLVTIARLSGAKVRRDLVAPFLRDVHLMALAGIVKSPVFTYIAQGNAHDAKALRRAFAIFVEAVKG